MYPIDAATKALFDAEQRQVLRITGQDRNGAAISITEANVMENGFHIDRYSCNGSRLEIGTAVAAELTLKLDNREGQFNGIIFEGAELFVEIGIADWTQEDPTITYIPCGYFTSDIQPRTLSTITINALDRMTRFDTIDQPESIPWTVESGEVMQDGSGNDIYFVEGLELPCTVEQLVKILAAARNVPLYQDISTFPNSDYVITEFPESQYELSLRLLIQWCAGLMGTNAWVDWNGNLRFSWYNNQTGYNNTTAERYSSDLYENAIPITGVSFTDDDEGKTVYLSGTSDYTLDLSSNYLINAGNAADILNNIYNVVQNFAYTPFTASVISAPYLWPMDRMTFTDANGNGHVSCLTNVNFGLNGSTALQSNGQTEQSSGGTQPNSFTPQQSKAIQRVIRVNSEAMQDAVDHATEMITGGLGGYVVMTINPNTGYTEEILIMDTPSKTTAVNVWRFNQGGLGHSSNGYSGPFNDIALTADGQINASMITTGELNANLIRTGTITDARGNNYWNLATGEIRMSSGSIYLGNFEVDANGVMTCTGANVNGTFMSSANGFTIKVDDAALMFFSGDSTTGMTELMRVSASESITDDTMYTNFFASQDAGVSIGVQDGIYALTYDPNGKAILEADGLYIIDSGLLQATIYGQTTITAYDSLNLTNTANTWIDSDILSLTSDTRILLGNANGTDEIFIRSPIVLQGSTSSSNYSGYTGNVSISGRNLYFKWGILTSVS